MGTDQNLFKGNRSHFVKVDLEVPLVYANSHNLLAYIDLFANAAKEAQGKGDDNAAMTYEFLAIIAGFYPRFESSSSPYGPLGSGQGFRSPIPSDLSPEDILALVELGPMIKDPALRARIFDVLWVLQKDHLACREAVNSYLRNAELIILAGDWLLAYDSIERGLMLAYAIGRANELFKETRAFAERATRQVPFGNFTILRYLNLILSFGTENPADFAEQAMRAAENAFENQNFKLARGLWTISADFLRMAGNSEDAQLTRLKAAETFLVESEIRVNENQKSSKSIAASILTEGVEALRRAGAPKEKIQDARLRLSEYQKESIKEMILISSGSVDISKMVESAQEQVIDENLENALSKFTFSIELLNLATIKSRVMRQTKQFFFKRFFASVFLDRSGRVKHKLPALGFQQTEESQIEAMMFLSARQTDWVLREKGFIEPARQQIFNDHHPNLVDLSYIVENNPFIPPGHEGIFLRGLHAGFEGDFLLASHLIVPQIENSMRYVLESHGVDVSNLQSDGTQPLKLLGPLFDLKDTERLFGPEYCFELRGLLIEKTGFEFRNELAHGFVTERDCFGTAAINIWWLILRICLQPFLSGNESG